VTTFNKEEAAKLPANTRNKKRKISLLLAKMTILEGYTIYPGLVLTHSAATFKRSRQKPCQSTARLCVNNHNDGERPCTDSSRPCETELSLFAKAACTKAREILDELTDEQLDQLLKEQELIDTFGADETFFIEMQLKNKPPESLKALIDAVAELSSSTQPRLIPTRDKIHNALARIDRKSVV